MIENMSRTFRSPVETFLDDLAAANIYLNFAREICSGWPFIPLSFFSNVTNENKPSANREKSASNNKKGEPKDKPGANREELANNNNRNSDNKLSADMKSLIEEKNINQDGNASIQKQEEAKMAGVVIERGVLSNLCSKFEAILDLQELE